MPPELQNLVDAVNTAQAAAEAASQAVVTAAAALVNAMNSYYGLPTAQALPTKSGS